MTDHHDPHDDPLAGRDPFPREQIDVLGLHRERAELLEEIVSTPGPGATAPSTRAKILLPVGIAAALVVVGGGAWFATSGDSDGGDDASEAPVVAASTSPSEQASEDGSEETLEEAATPDQATPDADGDVRVDELRVGEVLSTMECRTLRNGKSAGRMDDSVTLLQLRRGKVPLRKGIRYYLAGKDQEGRVVVIDERCQVVQVGRQSRDGQLLRLRPRPSDRR